MHASAARHSWHVCRGLAVARWIPQIALAKVQRQKGNLMQTMGAIPFSFLQACTSGNFFAEFTCM